MVTVQIGSAHQRLEDASESWITEQIIRRKLERQRLCVRVEIRTDRVNINLSTPGCPGCGGGGRIPNPDEEKIFELWARCRLHTHHFEPHDLVKFFKLAGSLI